MRMVDDFLNDEEFGDIVDFLNSESTWTPFDTHWTKSNKVSGDVHEDNWQYVHLAYDKMMPVSPLFEILSCVLSKLHVMSVYRIKVNCEQRHSQRYYSKFHYDYNSTKGTAENPIGHDFMTTGILYLNTCDGYTEFEDGKKVNSVANRFIEFPSNILHRGVSQTDTEWRSVINFNYFTGS